MTMHHPQPFILGISGLTSSGKTTLSRLLRSAFPGCLILHQDDFFHADHAIPVVGGLADWDCVEAVDFETLLATLDHVQSCGELPSKFVSKEDQNEIGDSGVGEQETAALRGRVREAFKDEGERWRRLVVVDGFLLFHDEEVLRRLDAKIFLRTTRDKAKERREARAGYVTMEGFWTDPPGYFDAVVWPNYVKNHQHLFVDGDVTGSLRPEVLTGMKIHSPKVVDMPMEEVFAWAVDLLIAEIKVQPNGIGIDGIEDNA